MKVLYTVFAMLMVTGLCGCERQVLSTKSLNSGTSAKDASAEEDSTLYGTIAVVDGFERKIVKGEAGGPVRASALDRSCKGSLTAKPGHELLIENEQIVTVSARPTSARMADLTLVIQSPDGTYQCVDDSEELNPVLELEGSLGMYKIWVGAYSQGFNEAYELIVESGKADPGAIAPAGPPPTKIDEGSYGGFRIAADTGHGTLEGVGGGTREASSIAPSCSGFMAMSPDHMLDIEQEMDLRVHVESAEDTILILHGPGDVVYCNDDTEGWNPVISETFSPGTWSVYVGTYEPSKYPEYTLHVSR